MKRDDLVGWLFAAVAVLLLVPAVATRPASAAQLEVSAAPIQTWKIVDGLPELPGPPVDLSDCGDLSQFDEVVYGTEADDDLTSGNGPQILVGLGGDDILRGGNHDDCLLGGEGDDRLFGDNGRDILLGESGVDELDGGSGKDRLDAGGDDGDECFSEGAPDELIGCGLDDVTAEDGSVELTEPNPVRSEPGAQQGGSDKGGNGDAGTPEPAADGSTESPPPPEPVEKDAEPATQPVPAVPAAAADAGAVESPAGE